MSRAFPPEYLHLPGFDDRVSSRAKLDAYLDRTYAPGFTPGVWDAETETIHVQLERPDLQQKVLADDFKGSQADALNQLARREGFDLVEIDMHERRAFYARLTPEARAIRKRLAAFLKCEPWALEVAVETEGTTVLLVQILRAPEVGTDAEKRTAIWRAAVEAIPGGHRDWRVEEDIASGRVLMENCPPLRLPAMVPLADFTPNYDPSQWSYIPHGIDTSGNVVGQKLSVPHGLAAGETGSGKSYFLLAHAIGALARGHDLVVIDPVKNAVDFAPLQPWMVAQENETISGAAILLNAVYAERVRRQKVLMKHGIGFWRDLPDEVREAENIHPLTVIIDECNSLLEESKINLSALDKDDPERIEFEEEKVGKAKIKLRLSKLGREARNVGIHIVLGLQRPDTDFLPGEFRSNVGNKVQLKVPGSAPMAPESLRMLFPGSFSSEAADLLARVGNNPGSGVTMAEGGSRVGAFKVAFAPALDLPALLEARGVPLATKWSVAEPSNPLDDATIPDAFDGFDDGGFDDDPWGAPQPAVAAGGGGEFTPSLDDLFT